MPYLVALEIRYILSLKGIKYLKNKNIINTNTMKELKELFITYCWVNEEYQDRVVSFVDYLRKSGYDAECDVMVSQNETAVDFKEMMHKAVTDYKKVIIILSPKYKERADTFEGGVGNEYRMILTDIEENKNKYILVSLDEFNSPIDIAPLSFGSRYIIDLSDKKNENELFARLSDTKKIEFSEVAKEKRVAETKEILDYNRAKHEIVINSLNITQGGYGMTGGEYAFINYSLSLEIENMSDLAIKDFSVEVHLSRGIGILVKEAKKQGDSWVLVFDNLPKLFLSQKKTLDLFNLEIKRANINQILSGVITIKVYTDTSTAEKEYVLSEAFKVRRDRYSEEEVLSVDMFHKGYW